MKQYGLWILLVPAFFISVILNVVYIFGGYQKRPVTKVEGIIDGDTVVLDGKTKVRLRYVDAPDKGMCGYDQASAELSQLVTGKSVRIERIIPDQYGRGMALVYAGNTLVNKEMVAGGWVRYHHDSTPEAGEIKAAGNKAREQKLGIYGTCHSTENPDNPECAIKGNIDKSTDTHIYYLPGCTQYEFTVVEKDIGEKWFCSEKEAKSAGYVKSKRCEGEK